MVPLKKKYNLAIVGMGRQGMAILTTLVPPQKEDALLRVIGVADPNPEAPGIIYASRHNLFVTVDLKNLLQLPELDIIVNATGSSEISHQLHKQSSGSIIVLSVDRPYSWENFWDLISTELSSQKTTMTLGLIGGGRAAHEVLHLITGDPEYKRRINLVGVADPDSEAQGIILAQSLKIPTYQDCSILLGKKPDLILELTGNPQVREQIIQHKDPETQIIDHVKARLFWDLLRYEEDWLHTKIENEIKIADQRFWFQRIFDHLPDPVLVINPDYLIEEANLPFLQRFQKKAEEVIGRPCYEVFHSLNEPCHRHGMMCPFPEVMSQHQTAKVLQSFDSGNGAKHYDEITMAPLGPPEGVKKWVIEVIRDITPRKQLEEALQLSEERARKDKAFLETIINGIQDHIMVIDLDYRVVDANRALLETVGRSRHEVVGKHCYSVSHHLKGPCADPDHPCPLKDAVATGKAASAVHVHFDKEGRERYYQIVCHPVYDENGRIRQVVDLARDITQEILARNQALHDDKMTSLGKLSASVVHEINNPLTGILNFVKLMQSMLADGDPSREELADMRQYLSIVYDETNRISSTLCNLLAFSRKTKQQFETVNLNSEITETISLIGNQLRLQNIICKLNLAEPLHPVLADKGQIKQILVNLILNAQEAMPQGGTLTLETKNRSEEVLLRIADTGKGIPTENLSKIFEPFFTTKKTCSGAGLGLSVVYGIVRDHKGIIKVDSVPGQGTTFTISLPALLSGEKHGATH
jgi:two-component system, NtrC family, sensor kinase